MSQSPMHLPSARPPLERSWGPHLYPLGLLWVSLNLTYVSQRFLRRAYFGPIGPNGVDLRLGPCYTPPMLMERTQHICPM